VFVVVSGADVVIDKKWHQVSKNVNRWMVFK